ncbi:MAG: DUF134 domain-containing protein [Victivallaceae bacterium]|nr:DUF134 domain-containing protein [Victivallaceae bacterium]
MPRPFKNRKINGLFNSDCYKPNGIPLSMLTSIELSVDELEALRLADLENMYQDAAAEKMGVSRQTFGNIIKSARKKVADAIINGKALKIISRGLSYSDSIRCCRNCGVIWRKAVEKQAACPSCESTNSDIPDEAFAANNFFRRGCGQGGGQGRGQGRGRGCCNKNKDMR